MVDDAENTVHICTISLWEIAIKVNLGKLKLNWTFNEFLRSVEMSDFSVLHIENKHLQKLADIPFLHKDPFDRLLISTALVENLTVITVDDCIRKYDVSWVW
jgi:PIN domain nuclease of toxin-antitoxin system